MRRWIAFAAALYPESWRQEYGDEFAALLDDMKPGWQMFANVLQGAIAMQIAKGTGWLNWMAATAAAGAILALALSFTAQPHYVSSAVLQISPQFDAVRAASPQALRQLAASHVSEMKDEILSRSSLGEIITRPSISLYPDERRRLPLEDIIQQMRRDIRIETIPPPDGGSAPLTFRISFEYPDRAKAKAVVAELVSKFVERTVVSNSMRTRMYAQFWRDEAAKGHASSVPPPPVGDAMAVVELPSLPGKVGTNRFAFLLGGLAAGLSLGLALRLRRRALLLCGCALAGFILALAPSYLIQDRFTSSAVMRLTPVVITEDPLAVPQTTPVAERLRQWEPMILSRENLARIIQDSHLDLYPKERATQPLDRIIETMRQRDLRIEVLNAPAGLPPSGTFRISFTYPDRFKAQAVVREFITQFVETNLRYEMLSATNASSILHDIAEHKAGEQIIPLDPPSLPEVPVGPHRQWIALSGLAAGLLLGALVLWRRQNRPPLAAAR